MWATYCFLREFYAKNIKIIATSDEKGEKDIHEADPSFDGSAHEGNPNYVHINVGFRVPPRRHSASDPKVEEEINDSLEDTVSLIPVECVDVKS
jgi:hypothetical protein